MRLAAAAVLTLALAAAAPAATVPTLVGKVTVLASEMQCGPKVCGQPAAPVVLRFTNARGVARLVETDAQGALRAWLPGGTYSVAAPAYQDVGGLTPTRLVLKKGTTKKVAFIIRIAHA